MIQRTDKSEQDQALELLTRCLTLRDHSQKELQEKLSKRFTAEIVESVFLEAARRGWLLPENEIAARAALTWQRKFKSRGYIEEQLRRRGLPVLKRDDEAELATMEILLAKKFGAVVEFDNDTRAKAIRFLKYRGFEDHLIGMVINEES